MTSPTAKPVAAALSLPESIIKAAMTYRGVPYVLGGISRDGVDCAGLIYRVYSDVEGIDLPRGVRALFRSEQSTWYRLHLGDLIFFDTDGDPLLNEPSHVGIYAGQGKFVHAASEGPFTGVIVSSLAESYYRDRFIGSRRVIEWRKPVLDVVLKDDPSAVVDTDPFPSHELLTIRVINEMSGGGPINLELSHGDTNVQSEWVAPSVAKPGGAFIRARHRRLDRAPLPHLQGQGAGQGDLHGGGVGMSQEAEKRGAQSRGSTVSTVIVMICTAASRLFGYVRQALFNYYFGASGAADALNAVFNIPNNLRKLFAEGAFSAAFIPVLSSTLAEDPTRERSQALVRTLIALELCVLLPLVALSLAFPRSLVTLLFAFQDPGKVAVAATLMRWTFNYVLFVSLGALVMAVLNTHGRFTVPALSPLMFTLPTVLSLIFFHGRLGILAMGVGVLVGGILQLAFHIRPFRGQGYRFR